MRIYSGKSWDVCLAREVRIGSGHGGMKLLDLDQKHQG